MATKPRSPNYPGISLPDAIRRLETLFEAIQGHPAPREVAAKGMGYTGLHGASATALSALSKYGLLERAGPEDVRISERGRQILHPHDEAERRRAIRDAAMAPKLFADLRERFPGPGVPNEELVRNYLLRNGFLASAVGPAILAFRETMELAARDSADYLNSGVESPKPTQNDMQPRSALPDSELITVTGKLGGSPMRLTLSPERIEVTASLTNAGLVDDLIKMLEATKALLPPKPAPALAQEDDEPAE